MRTPRGMPVENPQLIAVNEVNASISETKRPRNFLQGFYKMVPRLGVATYGYRQGHEDFQSPYAMNQKAPNISVQGSYE